MKYKVGDRVRIRKDLVRGQKYGKYDVTSTMQELGGKTACITDVNVRNEAYHIDLDLDLLHWTDEMFEDKKKMNDNDSIRILVNGNQVIAIHMETCKRGVARCHPDDDFDFYTGAKIALERLEEAEKPYAWLKAGMTYYFPTPATNSLCNANIYTADDWDKRIMERGIAFQTKEEAIACAKKMLAVVKQEG